jgi:hypothetical protein
MSTKLLLPDPWSIPGFERRDLYRLYLTDAILETAGIGPEHPDYESLVDEIGKALKVGTLAAYQELQDRLWTARPAAFGDIVPAPLTRPAVCPGDPRIVDTVSECLAWLAYRAKS